MIVKNTPIFHTSFPDTLVKKLSFSHFSPCVFLDIETNGLSGKYNFLYLIGVLKEQENSWMLTQWFAEEPQEEKELLEAFSSHIQGCRGLFHFNGARFDLPFIKARCVAANLPYPLEKLPSFDLCNALKNTQSLLKLPNRKYATAEAFLGLTREQDCSGKECIHLYQKYYATQKEDFLLPILKHNRLDLEHLPRLFSLLSYELLLKGAYTLLELSRQNGGITAVFLLEEPVPRLISYGHESAYLTAEGSLLKVMLTPVEGKLKKYYPDYKEYFYLPKEDTAIHKSVGIYVDKSLRKNATKETCYTWFPVTDEFLLKKPQAETYFQENLPALLGFF